METVYTCAFIIVDSKDTCRLTTVSCAKILQEGWGTCVLGTGVDRITPILMVYNLICRF